MSETHAATDDHADPEGHGEPGLYEIRVQGHLGDRWAAWFAGLSLIRQDNGDTLLTGPVVDQAALHGLLRKVRDLGVPLIAVTRVSPSRAVAPEVQHGVEPAAEKGDRPLINC